MAPSQPARLTGASRRVEAWNGLGHSLKNLGRFDDSVSAYQVALRIRPQYPQALEYLVGTRA